jgi:hypothetical protein
MLYTILLSLHSITRWLVLAAALYAIILAIRGVFRKSAWTRKDDQAGILFASLVDFQLLLGLVLYFFVSPITMPALRDFAGAMANSGTRFFAVEHSFMMVIGLVLVHIGRTLSKKGADDRQKHGRPLFRFG